MQGDIVSNGGPKVTFVTEDLGNNSLGRTYCLWQLAQALGWSSVVVSPRGSRVWGPLEGTDFAHSCRVVSAADMMFDDEILASDVLVAVKPLPRSFGVAIGLSRAADIPLVLDIDDPDLELKLSWERPVRRLGKMVLRRADMREWRRMRSEAEALPPAARIVSNPVLRETYGGTLIPHVRPDLGDGAPHVSRTPEVAFVGTNRGHKGLPLLREALRDVQDLGYTLTVTDQAPLDAQPWENWVGSTDFNAGMSLVANADVVIIPSGDGVYSRGQLPAKLVDAMMFGRAIGVSDVDPLPWALAGNGSVFRAGSRDGLVKVLREYSDPRVRAKLGAGSRERALSRFSVEGNVDAFRRVVTSAMRAD